MAILVLSSQELDQLKQKGYEFLPGDLGENILIENLPVDQIKPDMYLNFESGLSLQFSRICDPCSKLNQLPNIGSKRIKISSKMQWVCGVGMRGLSQKGTFQSETLSKFMGSHQIDIHFPISSQESNL